MGNAKSSLQVGGSGESQATLLPLPNNISDDAIAMMGLDEFLVRYGGVTPEIASTFSHMYSPRTSQQDMIVDLSFYMKLMPTQSRSNVIQVLRASYTRGIDFIERDTKQAGRWGGHGKKQILVSPDCFKRLCMRSKAANAETVRTYFLRMETLTRRYFGAKASKAENNVHVLLGNQHKKAPSKDELDETQGFIYIFPVVGRIPNLYRIGSTINPARRMREHGSSHGDSLANTAVFIKVYDVRKVEQAANLFLNKRKYNGSKEVYTGTFNMIKDTVMQCGMVAAIGIAADRGKSVDEYVPVIVVPSST